MFRRPVITSVLLLAGLLFPLAAVPADDDAKYLCVVDKGTGFFRNDSTGEWHAKSGKYDIKYLLKPIPGDVLSYEFPYGVYEFGKRDSEGPRFYCKNTPAEILEQTSDPSDQILYCEGALGGFRFGPNTMRFQLYYSYGYVTDSKQDTPYILIGECSRL